jgi:hypothetical protein
MPDSGIDPLQRVIERVVRIRALLDAPGATIDVGPYRQTGALVLVMAWKRIVGIGIDPGAELGEHQVIAGVLQMDAPQRWIQPIQIIRREHDTPANHVGALLELSECGRDPVGRNNRMCVGGGDDALVSAGVETGTSVIEQSAPGGAEGRVLRGNGLLQHAHGKLRKALGVARDRGCGVAIGIAGQHRDVEGTGSQGAASEIDLPAERVECLRDGALFVSGRDHDPHLHAVGREKRIDVRHSEMGSLQPGCTGRIATFNLSRFATFREFWVDRFS